MRFQLDSLVIGAAMMVVGVLAIWTGLVSAAPYAELLHRRYHRTMRQSGAHGWDAWYFGGFAGLIGMRRLMSMATRMVWILAGCCFIGLGMQFVCRR